MPRLDGRVLWRLKFAPGDLRESEFVQGFGGKTSYRGLREYEETEGEEGK